MINVYNSDVGVIYQEFNFWFEPTSASDEYSNSLEACNGCLLIKSNNNPAGQEGETIAFDIDKAVAYLISTAYENSKGRCSPHVVAALIVGGLTRLKGVPIKAGGSYGPVLKELGFSMISTTLDNYTPEKGDIAVINGYAGGTQCSTGPCGHIQLYTGDKYRWVSDFFQTRDFWPGQPYENAKPYFEIYRWK